MITNKALKRKSAYRIIISLLHIISLSSLLYRDYPTAFGQESASLVIIRSMKQYATILHNRFWSHKKPSINDKSSTLRATVREVQARLAELPPPPVIRDNTSLFARFLRAHRHIGDTEPYIEPETGLSSLRNFYDSFP